MCCSYEYLKVAFISVAMSRSTGHDIVKLELSVK
jgi:hypothetical protein